MNLVKPHGSRAKYGIRVRLPDGRVVKVMADRDLTTAKRIGDRIEMLIRAKQNGDPPPAELQSWITNMPRKLAERLLSFDLLDRRRLEQGTTLAQHIDQYEKKVATRRSNSTTHAKCQANRVRRVCTTLKATSFRDITEDAVLAAVATFGLSTGSRHHYLVAMKDFSKWAMKSKRTTDNPLDDLRPPGQYESPQIERVPLTVAQFQSLMVYLDTFDRYPDQRSGWNSYDRKLIYWTAVQIAFRKSELMSIRVRNLHFDSVPPSISISAKDAKNRTAGEVPIRADLAAALKAYVAGRELNDRVFRFPATSRSVIDMFRRDFKGASIPTDFGEGNPERVDFHTLRSTAITWWLDQNNLSPKKVQILARLKTLSLVARYSRNLRLAEFGWLDSGPVLVTNVRQQTA